MLAPSLLLLLLLAAAIGTQAKVHPLVREDVKHAAALSHHGNTASFLVLLKSIDIQSTAGMSWVERGQFVHDALVAHAQSTQRPILEMLETSFGQEVVPRVRQFSVVNALIVDTASEEVLEALVDLDSVEAIEPNRAFPVPLEYPEESLTTSDAADDAVEWNIKWVGMPELWHDGLFGNGTVYANADTGVQWTHEALFENYRGFPQKPEQEVAHDYNWWDGVRKPLLPGTGPCGIKSSEPCDDNGHGTHTTSTTVGSHGVGVAPGSRWIACRNMDRGMGSTESYLSCLEFFIAPTDLTGEHPRPELRPHAIGNSYGCPASEGCARNAFHRAVAAVRKAGIFMSVSAGNDGPGCSTINAPPAYEAKVFTVGASGKNTNQIAFYSSRGPVTQVKDSGMKPNVVAPGSSVRAAYPKRRLFPQTGFLRAGLIVQPLGEHMAGDFEEDFGDHPNTYAVLSGTSMASPHVGGAVLIMTQACPCLERNIAALEDVLVRTAGKETTGSMGTRVCGGEASDATPNSVYGHGSIQIARAVESCLAQCDAQ